MLTIVFIAFVAATLFVYIQQKTSRIEKNIKNVISFIKDIEKRIEDNKQHTQGVSNEFFSVEETSVATPAASEAEEDVESESEAESEAEAEAETQVGSTGSAGSEGESVLDNEIINIKFKLNQDDKEDYKKKTVPQLKELVSSLNLNVQDIQKLKKKELIELLDHHYSNASEDNNIDI